MKETKKIFIYYHEDLVGTLVLTKNKNVAFQYIDKWIENGFSISPFSLPLRKDVFVPKNNIFNGLFGVFSDSLPDNWGRLLIDRMLQSRGLDSLTELEKLTIISSFGMGALTYKPSIEFHEEITSNYDLDFLSSECEKILRNEEITRKSIDELYLLGGSSGGARPKANVIIDNELWIVKFNTHLDSKDAGKIEYLYSLCAKECGIIMSDTKLLDSKICDGFFATKRFDIKNSKRVHMISAASLLEVDYRSPAFDYDDLFKLTKILTFDNKSELLQLFRRMCFNVLAHNQDDHGKNFAYLYEEGVWKLSPAYDLTYSNTYYHEQTTSVNKKRVNINDDDLILVGVKYGLDKKVLLKELNNIKSQINKYLKDILNRKL